MLAGHAAIEPDLAAAVQRRLVCIVLDDPRSSAPIGPAVTIDVVGRRVEGEHMPEPLYDPEDRRVNAIRTGAQAAPTMG